MKYYVWLQYYLNPPGRNVQGVEFRYFTGHQHGVQPSQRQVDDLQGDLEARVQAAAIQSGVPYPGNDAVQNGRDVRTRSEK